MNYQKYVMQIDELYKEGSRGGNDAFYGDLKKRLDALSRTWVPQEGVLSAEEFGDLVDKQRICLAALESKLRG